MKNGILILTALMFGYGGYSQESFNYQLKAARLLQECDKVGNTSSFNKKLVPSHSKFSIVEKIATIDTTLAAMGIASNTITTEYYIIHFWSWVTAEDLRDEAVNASKGGLSIGSTMNKDSGKLLTPIEFNALNFNYSADGNELVDRFFRIKVTDLETIAKKIVRGWDVVYGPVTLPFKARLNKGEIDFSEEFNITAIGGAKFNFNKDFSVGFGLGAGLSSVTLDSASTNGELTEISERPALGINLVGILEFKRVQFIPAVGVDYIKSYSRDGWIFQGKPYFAFGIGYSLYSKTKAPEADKKTQ